MMEEELTGQIIKVFYKVYNALGFGFVERVYHNAMIIELADQGVRIETESPIEVRYEGRLVGSFAADLIVENRVLLELKAKESIQEAHISQLTNYLRSTNIEIGLLLNFGRRPEFKRKYFPNTNKTGVETETTNLFESLL